MKIIVPVFLAALIAISPAKAAVLVVTGTTGDGKSYLTVPTITFAINRTVSASGFNTLTFDFVNVWGEAGASSFASGSGLTFTDSAHPGVFSVSGWIGHASALDSFSNYDSILTASPNTGFTYTTGDIITLQGGTFTLNSADPSFSVFPGGSYEVYFVGLGTSGGPLSSAGVAVPEPSTWALFGVAALGLLARKSRKS